MKKVVALFLAGAMALSMAACTAPAAPAPEAPKAETPAVDAPQEDAPKADAPAAATEELHFVYVSPLLAHPVWLLAKDGFDQACKELGIKGDWVGPQNISPEEMAKLIEIAVAQKANAIITQGLVPAEPVKIATDAGIPVLIVDSDIPDAERLAFFGKDVNKQADLLLEAAQTKLGKDTPIKASIQVAALNYEVAHNQINAVKEKFATHPGGFEVVNITESKSDKMKATTEWQNTFNTYPEINLAINLAAEAGPACAKVVEEMIIRDKVLVYGVDDIEETLDLVRAGAMDGTIATSFFNYGYQASYWLYQNITEGKKPAEIMNDAGTIMIDKENVDTYGEALKQKVDLK